MAVSIEKYLFLIEMLSTTFIKLLMLINLRYDKLIQTSFHVQKITVCATVACCNKYNFCEFSIQICSKGFPIHHILIFRNWSKYYKVEYLFNFM